MAKKQNSSEIIHCDKCGGDYDSSYDVCPFCGGDDREDTQRTDVLFRGGGFVSGRGGLNTVAALLGAVLVIIAVIFLAYQLKNVLTSDSQAQNEGETDVIAETVTLSNETLTLEEGDSITLICTVTPEGWMGTVSWTSSDEGVAAVTQEGVVSWVGAGTATITAAAGDITASCAVTCGESSAPGISLSQTALTLGPSETAVLTVTANPEDLADSVYWSSSDQDVAAVASDGTVTWISAGEAAITATAGELTATCTVTCQAEDPAGADATGITLSNSSLTLAVGSSSTITAAVTPEDWTGDVSWSSSDTSVVTVAGGTVSWVGAGTATVTATAGNVSASCNVTCQADVPGGTEIVVTAYGHVKTDITLELAGVSSVDMTATGGDGSNYTWSISDTSVATVTQSGTVTALAVGVTTLTVTSGGQSTTVTVRVK